MENFQTVDEILDFPIGNEQDAADFYFKLADTTRDKSIRETFPFMLTKRLYTKKN